MYKNPNRAHEFTMMNIYLPKTQGSQHIRDDFDTDYLIEYSCDAFKKMLCENLSLSKIEDCLCFEGDYHGNGDKMFNMPIYRMCFLGTIKDYSDRLNFEFCW